MRKIVLLFLLLSFVVEAQETNNPITKGLLAIKGTLAIGMPTNYSGTNMYLSGNLEYYLEDNLSIKGGIWKFLGTSGAEDVFDENSTLFTGFYYHFKTKNNLDSYLGIEAGISWTRLKKPDDLQSQPYPYNISEYPLSINPVTGVATGLNYYATKWVHLFVEAKYVYGVHTSDIPAVSLSEFRVSFGLGFNL